MWKYFALLSAFFAAVTALLAKVGVSGIDFNLATAIRTTVVLILAWGIVFASGVTGQFATLTGKNLLFLSLSGLATGLSWLCYFKALDLGEVSKVAPIDKLSVVFTIVLAFLFLHEPVGLKVALGGTLILLGSLVILW